MADNKFAAKAAVITMHRVGNYGSVLQAVATKELLESLGLDVEFIDYWRPDQIDPAKWASSHSRFVRGPITKKIQSLSSREYFSRFADVFHAFVEENLPLTQRYTSLDQLRKEPPKADMYIVGSDQVWNTDYNIGGTEPYLLQFGSPDTPRLSLSSSIGKQDFADADIDLFKSTLPKFDWRSVREESAHADLHSMGIESEVIPDPTLLLPAETWRSIGSTKRKSGGFVLLYTLNRGTNIRFKARAVARDLGLPLVTLNPRPLPWVRHRNEYRVPEVPKFLELLSTASHVVTDSFHATAFSLNLGTPVSVSMPPNYAGRLTNILRVAGAESREIGHPEYTTRVPAGMLDAAQRVFVESREAAVAKLAAAINSALGKSES